MEEVEVIFACNDKHGNAALLYKWDQNRLEMQFLQPDGAHGGSFVFTAHQANDLINAIHGTQGPEEE